jgi:hypothetical protein
MDHHHPCLEFLDTGIASHSLLHEVELPLLDLVVQFGIFLFHTDFVPLDMELLSNQPTRKIAKYIKDHGTSNPIRRTY